METFSITVKDKIVNIVRDQKYTVIRRSSLDAEDESNPIITTGIVRGVSMNTSHLVVEVLANETSSDFMRVHIPIRTIISVSPASDNSSDENDQEASKVAEE